MSHEDTPAGDLRILAARNALFEVDLDLGRFAAEDSSRLDHFPDRLLDALPTVRAHKCMPGEVGGFVLELRRGTHIAHVVEHVLLELLHLADPRRQTYTGWTTPKRGEEGHAVAGIYTIHYQVNSSAQGRLAARCGVSLVSDLLNGRVPGVEGYLEALKESFEWPEPSC